jgi:hypothetical protein
VEVQHTRLHVARRCRTTAYGTCVEETIPLLLTVELHRRNSKPRQLRFSCSFLHVRVTAPSASPQNVRGRALNSTSIIVTWKAPPPESHNGVLTKFRLLYVNTLDDDEASDGEIVHSVDVPPTDSSYVMGGLAKWTPYKLWIAASNSAGEGPLSDVIVVQTDEDGA